VSGAFVLGRRNVTYSISVPRPHHLSTEIWQLLAIKGKGVSLPCPLSLTLAYLCHECGAVRSNPGEPWGPRSQDLELSALFALITEYIIK
jgi:hypothetical protein